MIDMSKRFVGISQVSYTYFMNGIGEPGFNFGISMLATNAKYDEKINGFLQFGYQF